MKYSLGYFILALLISACQKQVEEPPNIIFIMVDDLGYSDLSSYGNEKFSTPNIDQFIAEGLRFTNSYAAAPFCSPTRVALMTGKYPAKFKIGLREPLTLSPSDLELGLSPDVPTLTSLLKDQNYSTALFGKWHLGQTEQFLPSKHGVDQFFGIMCGAADHHDHKPFDRRRDLLFKRDLPNLFENDVPVEKEGYLNDLITDYSVGYINQKHESPFFLSVQFTAPHWPWQKPDDVPVDSISYSQSGSEEAYRSMVVNLDRNFGRIMDALAKKNLENTLVIFTNDNGGAKFANQGPLKGLKGSLYEGGIRVPAAVRWLGKIEEGSSTDQVIVTMDWTRTLLQLAGSPYAKNADLDGLDLSPVFSDPTKETDRSVFWRITNRRQEIAVRAGDFKYVRNGEGEFLFNLKEDIGEQNDLKERSPDVVNKLKQQLVAFESQILPLNE
jgi:arylsulfatase A-like enzyme